MNACIFTIVSANYMAFALTLMQSVQRIHPEIARIIVVADDFDDTSVTDFEGELVSCDDLGIDLIANMKMWYTVLEFSTAIKPYVFRYLFKNKKFSSAIYLDPDTFLYSSLHEAIDGLADCSLILTPHITRPLQGDMHPCDLSILKAGVYNLGFAAIANDRDGRHLVDWWCDRLYAHCRVDLRENFFTDQRWMDLAPAFVERSRILRHQGYNVAYWNLSQRAVTRDEDGHWSCNGVPLVLFHFSGIDPGNSNLFSRHHDRLDMASLGAVAALCDVYRAEVLANGWQTSNKAAYAYSVFGDGRPILHAMRRWVRRAIDDGVLAMHEPLRLGSTYFDAADATIFAGGNRLTRFAHQLWLDRPDLQREFDLRIEGGVRDYVAWLTQGAAEQEGFPPQLIEAARALGEGRPARAPPPQPVPPPWPSVATDAWRGAARDAAQWLAGEVRFDIDGIETRLQRQIALLWERRVDLQHTFPLRTWSELEALHGWALTEGMREKAIDADLFTADYLAWLDGPSSVARDFVDMPMTRSMMLTRRSGHAREGLRAWRRFPAEPDARLEQAFWHAFLAPAAFGWPAAMTATVRRYFDAASDVGLATYHFSRGMLAIHAMRADVQQAFDLSSEPGRWAYLRWLLLEGTREYRLNMEELCPGVTDFMSSPWQLHPMFDHLAAFAYIQRDDLRAAFDLTTRIDRLRMRDWLRDELRPWLDDIGLSGLRTSIDTPGAVETSPHPHRCFLVMTGDWRAGSGIGEDLRSAVASLEAVGFGDYLVVDLPARVVIRPDGSLLPANVSVRAEWNVVYRNADRAYDDWCELRRLGIEAERVAAHWLWELERLPARWIHAFSFCDEVWASSQFVRTVFEAEERRPVRLIHHAIVVPYAPRETTRRRFKLEQEATIFLFVFDFASYMERKNPAAVIRAFTSAFPRGDERACLLIKTRNAILRPDLWDELVASTDDPRIMLRNLDLSRDETIELIACADAFVSLHRSEGFGRGPAEAMMLGVPVILTAYSGTADFTADDCACLVGYTLVAVQPNEYPAAEGQRWAEANIDEAAWHMRWVYQEPEAARAMGKRGQRRAGEMLASDKIGAEMLALLRAADHRDPAPADIGHAGMAGDAGLVARR